MTAATSTSTSKPWKACTMKITENAMTTMTMTATATTTAMAAPLLVHCRPPPEIYAHPPGTESGTRVLFPNPNTNTNTNTNIA